MKLYTGMVSLSLDVGIPVTQNNVEVDMLVCTRSVMKLVTNLLSLSEDKQFQLWLKK